MAAKLNQANASAVLLEANNDACLLLDKLDKDAKVGAEVTGFLVNSGRALIFTWTVKAGVVLGLSAGGGFMITRLEGNKWSAPLFISKLAGQAGAIIGVEKVTLDVTCMPAVTCPTHGCPHRTRALNRISAGGDDYGRQEP